MLHAELKVIGGTQNDQVVPLQQGKFLIGREQDCQLRPNSELVSRHHCVFTVDEYGIRVRDLGSTNGTFVNGERIEKPVAVKAGDQVTIGSLNFEVMVREAAPVAAGDGPAAPDAAGPAEVTPIEVTPADPALENTETGSETLFEMPALQEGAAPPADDQQVSGGDTTMIPNPAHPQQQMPPAPQYAPPPIQYPPGYGQYQPQPMYPPQYPGMPYPQPMPGYPMAPPPMQPQPHMPPQQMAPPPQQPAAEPEADGGVPDVTLPKPSETGLKEETDTKGSAGASKDGENPSGTAGDIIKQYIQRRPT